MFKWVFLLFSFSLSANYASYLGEHFKKPTEKEGYKSIDQVDFIYMINLDQRPEKYQNCLKELVPYGILPYRFSAVNGWELTFESLNNLGIPFESWMGHHLLGTFYLPYDLKTHFHEVMCVPEKNYYSHCMSRGAIGIVLSHLSVLQDALDSGYETIWVMEDDITAIQDPRKLSSLIQNLDETVGKDGWDILFTDRNTKNDLGEYVPCKAFAPRPNFFPQDPNRFLLEKPVGPNFIQIGARYGAYSMIVRKSGMEKILNFIKEHHIFLPYDMEYFLPEGIRLFTVSEDVVSFMPGSLSDNGNPNYLKPL